jgi:hypothetical protein
MLNIAEGRMIGERKHRIDLYVWFDGPTKQLKGYIFSRDTVFQADICSWFGLDPANIRD